jgi:hypothetical protein
MGDHIITLKFDTAECRIAEFCCSGLPLCVRVHPALPVPNYRGWLLVTATVKEARLQNPVSQFNRENGILAQLLPYGKHPEQTQGN